MKRKDIFEIAGEGVKLNGQKLENVQRIEIEALGNGLSKLTISMTVDFTAPAVHEQEKK